MKILFAGGGTMGSVIPLIAIAEQLKVKDPNASLFWIGTKNGPERKVVQNYNIDFKEIFSGKMRRYFSLQNFLDIFKIIFGFFQSLFILKKIKPDIILSAGGFVAVPVVWAGWMFGISSLIHQQDVFPGLANKLCAWPAKKITICFPESSKYFNMKKVKIVGNPVRSSLKDFNIQDLYKKFNLKAHLPIVLVTTGGRGSLAINKLIMNSLKELTKFCQIIHITGKNKPVEYIHNKKIFENYYEFEFMIDTVPALQVADLIISRAGMGILTEIAYLSKPSIIIPIPNSHQEDNAKYFKNRNAIIYLSQKELDEYIFVERVKKLIKNKKSMQELGKNVHNIIKWGAEEEISELVIG